jgi:urease accessory protein
MLTFTQRLSTACKPIAPLFTLALTAEERTRSRYRFELQTQAIFLRLPRGTVLQDGDRLQAETGEIIQIAAKPEPVMTVRAETALDLLKAAYHLGNRHVPLEITPNYLRLSPDPVLKEMLERMKVIVVEEIATFVPEIGAYHRH